MLSARVTPNLSSLTGGNRHFIRNDFKTRNHFSFQHFSTHPSFQKLSKFSYIDRLKPGFLKKKKETPVETHPAEVKVHIPKHPKTWKGVYYKYLYRFKPTRAQEMEFWDRNQRQLEWIAPIQIHYPNDKNRYSELERRGILDPPRIAAKKPEPRPPETRQQKILTAGRVNIEITQSLITAVINLFYYFTRDFIYSTRIFGRSNNKRPFGIELNFIFEAIEKLRDRILEKIDYLLKYYGVSTSHLHGNSTARSIISIILLWALVFWLYLQIFDDKHIRLARAFSTVGFIIVMYWVLNILPLPEDIDAEWRSSLHRYSAKTMLKCFLKNGGMYIKAGQTIASLNNLLPKEFTDIMAPCQDKCEIMGYSRISKAFKEEFGKYPEYFYSEFDEKPLAAASLGQVHRARLHDGTEVAVKVQFPGIDDRTDDDLWAIRLCVNAVEKVFPELKLTWLMNEFEEHMKNEMDFLMEARNSEQVQENFEHRSDVIVPKIFRGATSPRILTMEFVDAVKITDIEGLRRIGANPFWASRVLSEVFSAQIFIHGFIHCDPHPGNILVRRDPETEELQLVILDHGLYRNLTPEFRLDYCNLWRSLMYMDDDSVVHYADRMNAKDAYQLFMSLVTSRKWNPPPPPELDSSGAAVHAQSEDEIQSSTQYNIVGVLDVLSRVPRQMLLLFKCNDLLRNVQHHLGVPINYFGIMAHYGIIGRNIDNYNKKPSIMTVLQGQWDLVLLSLKLNFYTGVLWALRFVSKHFGICVSDELMAKIELIYAE
eukprot:gb/GECH01001569.1/.p1 GENE.gb/GECH01001569.1/~~gb/GECH01001569.1/.p1  ORF type:complete len:767 (+),score=166.01 gb/GECH01001569.1/:1-2301(+)